MKEKEDAYNAREKQNAPASARSHPQEGAWYS
jgi:hypothetical protein